jgi:Domain of unknown function (DUF1902)
MAHARYGSSVSKTASGLYPLLNVGCGGHCDIPAASDAPTLDELLAKTSSMALDLLSDNHPEVDPRSLFLQITALREAEQAV